MPELTLQFPATPEFANQHAELIVQSAKELDGVDLDYMPESLTAVDDIIDQWHNDGFTSDQFAATLFCFGCYVGEVLVRNNSGKWRLTEETSMADIAGFPMVVELGTDHFCNPIGKTFKRLDNGDEDSLPYFYRVVTIVDGD